MKSCCAARLPRLLNASKPWGSRLEAGPRPPEAVHAAHDHLHRLLSQAALRAAPGLDAGERRGRRGRGRRAHAGGAAGRLRSCDAGGRGRAGRHRYRHPDRRRGAAGELHPLPLQPSRGLRPRYADALHHAGRRLDGHDADVYGQDRGARALPRARLGGGPGGDGEARQDHRARPAHHRGFDRQHLLCRPPRLVRRSRRCAQRGDQAPDRRRVPPHPGGRTLLRPPARQALDFGIENLERCFHGVPAA